MRKKMTKLQYLCPQTEVVAADVLPVMAKVSFYGHAGDGDLEEVNDAKGSILNHEFTFDNVWDEEE